MKKRKRFQIFARAHVVNNKDEVLLVQNERGCWVLAGGKQEPGESAEQAVLRELKEETGLRGKVVGYIGSYPSSTPFSVVLVFKVAVKNYKLKAAKKNPKKKQEIFGIGFFPKDALPTPMTEHTKQRLADATRRHS